MNHTIATSSFVLLSSLSTILAPGTTCAQEQPSSPQPANTAARFVLEAGSHEVPEVIDRVAAFLDYNILFEAPEVTNAGQIRLTRRTEVDREGCWELFGALLQHKGLAILPLDAERGFHHVVSMNGPRRGEVTISAMFVPFEQIEAYANLRATAIQTSVPLRNINATIATNALRPFFASAGGAQAGLTLGNVGNDREILVQGFGHQVVAACRMLQRVDIGEKRQIETVVVRLEHASADSVVARLQHVFDTRGMQSQMQLQQGAVGPAQPTPRAVAHPELNCVILVGTEESCREAMSLINRLDMPSETPRASLQRIEQQLAQFEARLAKLEQALRAAK